MRRFKVLCLTVVMILAAVLTGCHGAQGKVGFTVPESFDESKNYEITFWAKNDTNKTQTDIYKKAIADFQKLYPNIKVNLKLYTDYGKIYNDVITNLATDTTPNVCITYPDHIATYLTGENSVVVLDQLFDNEQYGLGGSELRYDGPLREEITSKFLDECKLNGAYYGIPYMRSTEACYINKTYVEKLGYELPETLTWDFVWEVAEAATKKDANGNYVVNGQKVMIPFIYKSTDNMMIQSLKQLGGGYSNENGEILIFNDTTKEILYTVAEHVATDSFSTFKISSYPANFLNAGQCVFAIDSTAGSTWMGTNAPLSDISEDKLVDFETAVMPIPQYDPENPQMISQGPSICIFNKEDPQEVLASWLFAQYLLTNETQVAYAQTEGYLPVTSKAYNSPEYTDYMNRMGEDNELYYDVKIKASKIVLDHIDHTFVTPVFNGSTSLRDASGQMIENTAKSVNRKQTVDEAYMEALFKDMKSLYHLDEGSRLSTSEGTADLGPLPTEAKMLLGGLVIVWIGIIVYAGKEYMKAKKTKES